MGFLQFAFAWHALGQEKVGEKTNEITVVPKLLSAIDLQNAGLMEKIEDYNNKVGFSERTNVPIGAAVIIGGVKTISKVCGMLVPFMALFYPSNKQ